MRFDTIFVSFALALMMFGAGMLLVTEQTLNSTYEVSLNPNETQIRNLSAAPLDSYFETAESMKDILSPSEVSGEESENNLLKAGWNVLTSLWDFIKGIFTSLNAVAIYLGVPQIIINGLIVILTIILVFGMVYQIMRFKPSNR